MGNNFSIARLLFGCTFALAMAAPPADACTAFVLNHPDRVILGEGFDWHTGDGWITITPTGLVQESLEARMRNRPRQTWTVRYGNVGFGWAGIGLPTCGMNTAGLAVTALLFSQGRLPAVANAPVIGISQWKQYVLDTCATVAEAIATLNRIQLATLSHYKVHYLLADRTGAAAVVQYIDGRRHVVQGDRLAPPVLTNDLRMDRMTVAPATGQWRDLTASAPDRYTRASRLVMAAAGDPPDRLDGWAERIFDSVRVPGYTRWNIAFDLTHQRIWLRTDTQPQRRTIRLADIDFSCAGGLRVAPIQETAIAFTDDLTHSGHRKRVADLTQSARFSPVQRSRIQNYPFERRCAVSSAEQP